MEHSPHPTPQENKQSERSQLTNVVEVRREGELEVVSINDNNFPNVEARVDHSQQHAKLDIRPGIYGLTLTGKSVINRKYERQANESSSKWLTNAMNLLEKDSRSNTAPVIIQAKDGIAYRDNPADSARAIVVSTDEEKHTTARYLGSEEAPIGTYAPSKGDIFLVSSRDNLEIISNTPAALEKFDELVAGNKLAPYVFIEMEDHLVTAMQAGARKAQILAARNKATENASEVNVAETDPQREADLAKRSRRILNKKKDSAHESDEVLAVSQKEDITMSSKPGTINNDLLNDEERQAAIDEARGFRVVDRRTWNRNASINNFVVPAQPKEMPTVQATPAAAAPESKVVYKVATRPPKPSRVPTVGVENVPATPEASPTDEGEEANNTSSDDAINKMSFGDKIKNFPSYFAAKMNTARMMRQNKRAEQAAQQNKNSSASDKEARKNERKKAVGMLLGAGAALLVYKYGYDQGSGDGFNLTNWDIFDSTVDGDVSNNVAAATEQVREAVQEGVEQVREATVDGLEQLQDALDGNNDIEPITPEAPVETTPEFSEAASNVFDGEGWYQTFEDMGIPAQDHAALLQKVGPRLQELGWAYPADDGTWGISRPGALPDDVLKLIQNSR